MDQNVYVDILENIMLPYAEEKMPLLWVPNNTTTPNIPVERLINSSWTIQLKL